jgi:hypothetical protein
MKTLQSKCTPGYPMPGATIAFTAVGESAVHAARVQWGLLGRNADASRVQTVITDVPDSQSAPSLVRRT